MITLKKNKPAIILGIMSGTSLDGLDLALCEFKLKKGLHVFRIIKSKTFPYAEIWKQRLTSIKDASAEKYFAMNVLYGTYVADRVNEFLAGVKDIPVAIASHGHTVFHQPHAGFTVQIGCGATIAARTGITTVCDFRSLDVALHGQGAPLVPIGDKMLFGDYQACLNLGGIANISYDVRKKRVAYDVCVANMLLNYLAEGVGEAYDEGGEKARSGRVNRELLKKLSGFDYYNKEGAKSMGREWFERNMLGLFEKSVLSVNDQLATAIAHISDVIAAELNRKKLKSVLVSGGGAFNSYLIEQIASKTKCRIILPDADIINFKEALIFAFLGYLRLNHEINSLGSVTGASRDNSGGAVYIGKNI
jgi:anhydro-N-acetylmuramic acid kinase